MAYPVIDFNDPELDYSYVYSIAVLMYSDLNAQLACCIPKNYQETFNLVNVQFANIPYDFTNNEVRWKSDVKAAYLLLYPLAS